MAGIVVPSDFSAGNTCDRVKEVHAWNSAHKSAIRQLTRFCLRTEPVIMRCWQETTITLSYVCEQHGYSWQALADFEVQLAELTLQGELEKAMWLMAFKIHDEISTHWPDCDLPVYQDLVRLCAEHPRP